MQFQDLDLDVTSPWINPKNTVEYNFKSYGDPLYKWIEQYTDTADPSVFEENKQQIEVLYKLQPQNKFFYRLAKIIYLYKEWDKNKSWKDPVIVRPMLVQDNRTLYIVNPGQDRWLVMKHFGVKSYRFLVLDTAEFVPDSLETLTSMWSQSKLEFRQSNDKWTLINTEMKFNTTIILSDWFTTKRQIAKPFSARDKALEHHKKRSL